MSSPPDLDKRPNKFDDDDDDVLILDEDDEETRMRGRLLARRAKQLKEMIDAEPMDESTSTSTSTSKKSHHHHHHKKKKRRHDDSDMNDNDELEEGESKGSPPSDRLPSVASAVSAVIQPQHQQQQQKRQRPPSSSENLGEEEGLNIKPPQPYGRSGHEKYRHEKRSRERSPDYGGDRSYHRSDNYEMDRKRRERADEGWSSWKKSLDRPYGRGYAHGSRGGVDLQGSNRSPSGKPSASGHGYRSREGHSSRSPSSSTRWLSTTKSGSSGTDRTRSHAAAADYQQRGADEGKTNRDDRNRDHRRQSSEKSSSSSSKRGRTEGGNTKSIASAVVPASSAAVNIVSPETTPTMDEAEDDSGRPRKLSGGGSKEGRRSRSEVGSIKRTKSKESTRSGATTRSSIESGEHRSDPEGTQSKDQAKEKEVKKAKYSKFESSESESESDADQEQHYKEVAGSDVSDIEEDGGDQDKQEAATAVLVEDDIEPVELDVSPAPEDMEPELPVYYPALMGCRSVEEFHSLNRIEEGTYGVVYRAKEKRTDEIVALKRLKMEKEKEGFPITSLREINMLLKAGKHPNIVKVREIVVGSNMDKIYLVMDYVEHDLKSLLETMKQPFLIGEVKTLLKQILAGMKHLHENWILHRDLKTSNLLLSHKGILKIADFGLAREYGSPLKPYTAIVVTLWYRSPELLLGIKEYSTPIDVWSIGCIFAEILTLKPLFTGKSEIEQLNKIFMVRGTPNDAIWPGYSELPGVKRIQFVDVKFCYLRKHFGATLSGKGFELMKRLLTYDPVTRITAAEALEDDWFREEPRPVHPDMFPTWPAKSEQSKAPRKGEASPKPPSGGKQFQQQQSDTDKDYLATLKGRGPVGGFSLKFDAPKF